MRVSRTVDAAMDKSLPNNKEVVPGISLSSGPMLAGNVPMRDVDSTNGYVKRKVRESMSRPSYADAESSDDDDLPISKKRKLSIVEAKVMDDEDSDDAPLMTKPKMNGDVVRKPPKINGAQIGESSSTRVVEKKLVAEKQKIERAADKEAKAIRQEDKKAADKPSKKPTPIKRVKKEDPSDDDDAPLARKVPAIKSKLIKKSPEAARKATKSKPVKKEESAAPEEDEDEEEVVARPDKK